MTQRTKSQLMSMLPDNIAGAISESTIRDIVDSLASSHGSFYITTPQPTTIAVPGTFVKAAGLTTINDDVARVSMPVDNRLRYDGVAMVHAHIVVNISTICGGNNQNIQFAVAKNDIILDHSVMEHRMSTGSDIKMMAIHADTMLSQGDYLELWCTNLTSTATITAQKAYMFLLGMFQ